MAESETVLLFWMGECYGAGSMRISQGFAKFLIEHRQAWRIMAGSSITWEDARGNAGRREITTELTLQLLCKVRLTDEYELYLQEALRAR